MLPNSDLSPKSLGGQKAKNSESKRKPRYADVNFVNVDQGAPLADLHMISPKYLVKTSTRIKKTGESPLDFRNNLAHQGSTQNLRGSDSRYTLNLNKKRTLRDFKKILEV